MKILLLLLLSAKLFSQEVAEPKKTTEPQQSLIDQWNEETEETTPTFSGKPIYTYKTLEDYQNDVSQKIGYFWHYAEKRIDGWKDDKTDFSLDPNTVWGFRIDETVFRCIDRQNPLAIISQKEKTFYANGKFFLHGWRNYSEAIDFFYSDDIESPVQSLDKLSEKEGKNLKYMPLFQCIRESKRGKKEEVNSKIYSCLKSTE